MSDFDNGIQELNIEKDKNDENNKNAKNKNPFLIKLDNFYREIASAQIDSMLSILEEIVEFLKNRHDLDDAIECYRIGKLISQKCEEKIEGARMKIEKIEAIEKIEDGIPDISQEIRNN